MGAGGEYGEDIYVSTHVDDCLICCKSTATMSKFKQELLTRFQGTDEREVKEYLGCEVIRDRAARTGKMVQAGYAESVLRTFGMWGYNPVLTPLDPNVRLTKRDSPEVVDPRLHRHMRSIVGCLSYLVNMTRPDLAFTYSQLSKFVQAPGPVHLAAAERALAYLRGTYNEGITYCDPGEERRNKLTGWVDSYFAADPDTRKSMTGYHYLRELVRDGHVKLLKCAGPQNVADVLAKSLPRPALAKHRQYMWGTRIPFQPSISLSRLDGPRRRLIISSHHADIESHEPPEKYFLGGCSYACVCVCRYDLRCHDRHRGRAK
jgi:hypothetical protein